MRKIIEYTLASIDGVFAGPELVGFLTTATTPTTGTVWACWCRATRS